MGTVLLIVQCNKPPSATALTSVLPRRLAHRRTVTSAGTAAPFRACASAVAAMARRWHERRATGLLSR